jgi:hypothetical protein
VITLAATAHERSIGRRASGFVQVGQHPSTPAMVAKASFSTTGLGALNGKPRWFLANVLPIDLNGAHYIFGAEAVHMFPIQFQAVLVRNTLGLKKGAGVPISSSVAIAPSRGERPYI